MCRGEPTPQTLFYLHVANHHFLDYIIDSSAVLSLPSSPSPFFNNLLHWSFSVKSPLRPKSPASNQTLERTAHGGVSTVKQIRHRHILEAMDECKPVVNTALYTPPSGRMVARETKGGRWIR